MHPHIAAERQVAGCIKLLLKVNVMLLIYVLTSSCTRTNYQHMLTNDKNTNLKMNQ